MILQAFAAAFLLLNYTISLPALGTAAPQTLGYPLHIYVVDQNPSYTDTFIAKLKITLKGTYSDRATAREADHNVSLTIDKYSYVNELS